MLQRLLDRVADRPSFWDFARSVIEASHRTQKAAIRRELGEVDGPLLDVPCGTGIFAPLFPPVHYTGIDLSDLYVGHARKKFPEHRFRTMDALATAFDDDSFEAVLVVGFLHHLDESQVEGALREIRRLLRPGGRFLLIEDCPTRSNWNLPGRVLQSLDAGGRIRPAEWYRRALGAEFEIVRDYPLRSGLWDYSVFVLR